MSENPENPLAPLKNSALWQSAFKLEWANIQIQSAHWHIQQYVEAGKCGVREERDDNGHRYVLFAERMPRQVPMAFGSAIHALRSALDTAVSTLYEGRTGKQSSRVSFPFDETEAGLKQGFDPQEIRCKACDHVRSKKCYHSKIDEALPELRDLLLGTFKPWRDGNFPLWALNKLDNYQKHRMLLLVLGTTKGGLDHRTPEGATCVGNLDIIVPGQERVIASSRKQVLTAHQPHIGFDTVFPVGVPFAGEPAFDVFAQLGKVSLGVLDTLLATFDGDPALRIK